MAENAPQRGERDVVAILAKALRKLGQAGEVDAAMRLGGQAWWALNAEDPDAAEHINGVMHYLARLPQGGPVGTGHADDGTVPADDGTGHADDAAGDAARAD